MLKIKRIIFVSIFVLFLTACSNNEQTDVRAKGFLYIDTGEDEPMQEVYCAYRFQDSEFGIGDITVSFYIGIPNQAIRSSIDERSSIVIFANNGNNTEDIELYTFNVDDYERDTFEYERVYNKDDSYIVFYEYMIEIILPEILFNQNSDMIDLGFGVYTNIDDDIRLGFSTYQIINYAIQDTSIRLVNK